MEFQVLDFDLVQPQPSLSFGAVNQQKEGWFLSLCVTLLLCCLAFQINIFKILK